MSAYLEPPRFAVEDAVRRALVEDLMPLGDISASLVPEGTGATATFVSRAAGVLAGTGCATETFAQVAASIQIDWLRRDGDDVEAGEPIGRAVGALTSILIAERTALNFLMHLSGIATNTRRFVDAATGPARVWDTRKTTPGLRALEKAAVRCGGAHNHRGNLSDWIMLKDNHLVALTIEEGVAAARERWPGRTIHVEADGLAQVEAAVAAGADAVLLDNMTPAELRSAVDRIGELVGSGRRPIIEASGGIDLDSITGVSHSGVDMISTSKLNFGVPTLDIGLDIVPEAESD